MIVELRLIQPETAVALSVELSDKLITLSLRKKQS